MTSKNHQHNDFYELAHRVEKLGHDFVSNRQQKAKEKRRAELKRRSDLEKKLREQQKQLERLKQLKELLELSLIEQRTEAEEERMRALYLMLKRQGGFDEVELSILNGIAEELGEPGAALDDSGAESPPPSQG